MRKGLILFIATISLALLFSACGKKSKVTTAAEETDANKAETTNAASDFEQEVNTADSDSLELGSVFFEFDQSSLTSEAKRILRENADLLLKQDGTSVVIEGHCDERGSVEYNLALGERRAQSIKNYLIQLGVSPDRLSTLSYGEERPMVSGSNQLAWSKNRRGAFVVSR